MSLPASDNVNEMTWLVLRLFLYGMVFCEIKKQPLPEELFFLIRDDNIANSK